MACKMKRKSKRHEGEEAVLRHIEKLAADHDSRRLTVLGRFIECRELQMASALFAKAVEHCSRWHGGKRLTPPGGGLPPVS